MTRIALTLSLLALLLVACENKTPAPSSTTGAAPATAAPPSSVASAEQGAIPTEEDYEDQAEQKVTPENAEKELDQLEKEISN